MVNCIVFTLMLCDVNFYIVCPLEIAPYIMSLVGQSMYPNTKKNCHIRVDPKEEENTMQHQSWNPTIAFSLSFFNLEMNAAFLFGREIRSERQWPYWSGKSSLPCSTIWPLMASISPSGTGHSPSNCDAMATISRAFLLLPSFSAIPRIPHPTFGVPRAFPRF